MSIGAGTGNESYCPGLIGKILMNRDFQVISVIVAGLGISTLIASGFYKLYTSDFERKIQVEDIIEGSAPETFYVKDRIFSSKKDTVYIAIDGKK